MPSLNACGTLCPETFLVTASDEEEQPDDEQVHVTLEEESRARVNECQI